MKTRIKWLPPVFLRCIVAGIYLVCPASNPRRRCQRHRNPHRQHHALYRVAGCVRVDRKGGGRLFRQINERGGINGRKIRFISRDDSANPKMAIETKELVEQERVHLMFGSFGTPSNLATRRLSQ